MSQTPRTAAGFLTTLETAVGRGLLSKSSYAILVKDMSSILDGLNENPNYDNSEISIREEQPLTVEASNYFRRYENNLVETEIWSIRGVPHREGDKPAEIRYYDNGVICEEQWAEYNKGNHRDGDKPAVIFYSEDGTKNSEQWWVKGDLHRGDDKPAYVGYDNSGIINAEVWYFYGKEYRPGGGPTKIFYPAGGKPQGELRT